MIRRFVVLFVLINFIACMQQDRVKNAYEEKEQSLKQAFKDKGLDWYFKLYIRVFKAEKELEIWVFNKDTFQLFKTYAICNMSGTLGRKYKQGDKQVPEGFYTIERFNPKSNFHLSLGLNYPNQADAFFSNKSNPGGDIFIHGDCVSIGCMAMTDDKIKEIYLLASEAKKFGQNNIAVHVFPFKMTTDNFQKYSIEFPQWVSFWRILQMQYDYFEKEKRFLEVTVSETGEYKL
jgi:murein L,D-transpeptidase YafK